MPTRRYRISSRAYADLQEISDYLEEQSPTVAITIINAFWISLFARGER